MSFFYGILAVTGWIFAAIVLVAYMIWRLSRSKSSRRGFDAQVAPSDEKQH